MEFLGVPTDQDQVDRIVTNRDLRFVENINTKVEINNDAKREISMC